jgi:hypothetical protein
MIPGLPINKNFDETGDQTIQAGYAGPHAAEIHVQANACVGSLFKAGSDTITIFGGYDSAYATNSRSASIFASVTLPGGTTRVRNIAIRHW